MRKKKKGLQAVGLEPTNPKEWCLKPTRLTTSLHLRNFINKRAPLSGIEPLTLRLTAVRSNQLSYKGTKLNLKIICKDCVAFKRVVLLIILFISFIKCFFFASNTRDRRLNANSKTLYPEIS